MSRIKSRQTGLQFVSYDLLPATPVVSTTTDSHTDWHGIRQAGTNQMDGVNGKIVPITENHAANMARCDTMPDCFE